MKNTFKLLAGLGVAVLLSACATKPVELDRTVFESNKIEAVRLNTLPQSISIELSSAGTVGGAAGAGLLGALVGGAIDAGVNSSRKSKFAPILAGLGDFDANTRLEEALARSLEGLAFAPSVEISKTWNQKDRKVFLVPTVTPSIVMSANYGVINVLLSVATYQNKEGKKPYLSFHSSQQLVEDDGVKVDKDANRQFWLDNPEVLIEKINAGIDEVAQLFADNFNGVEASVDQTPTASAEVSEDKSEAQEDSHEATGGAPQDSKDIPEEAEGLIDGRHTEQQTSGAEATDIIEAQPADE